MGLLQTRAIQVNMSGSSKELTAVIVNLKEARILDKSVQTLALEESYASKLLDLNSKMVKFNYGRLKNNVNKIRSYLKPEEISVMRSLESDGKFKAEHPMICSSSNATKIAAAHRRLNLNSYRRAQSAMPRIRQQHRNTKLCNKQDAVTKSVEISSLDEISEPSLLCSHQKERPKTTILSGHDEINDKELTLERNTTLLLEKITRAQKANKIHSTQVTYSCHDEKPPESDDSKGNKSVLDAFGPNPYEERRQKLLKTESQAFSQLTNKKQGFVEKVEKFIQENPCPISTEPAMTQEIINSIDSMTARPGRQYASNGAKARLPKRHGRLVIDLFAEIRKTRYLRVDDSQIDYSNSGTLAREFMKKTVQWRHYESKPLSFHDSAML